jgi:hypothetical protein
LVQAPLDISPSELIPMLSLTINGSLQGNGRDSIGEKAKKGMLRKELRRVANTWARREKGFGKSFTIIMLDVGM